MRIVQVAGQDGLGGADDLTGWLEPDVDAVRAEVALRSRLGDRVDIERVVGAGLHAGLAADAPAAVEVDDAVVPLEEGLCRADSDAGCIVAMVAAQH